MVFWLEKLKRSKRGNISMIALTAGIVIIVGTAALMGYMVKDVDFAGLDEAKLRAINLAEAGVSDIYNKLDSYYSGESETLPSSPYTGEVADDYEVKGSFEVEYSPEYNDSNEIIGYYITSKGIDNTGVSRSVSVNLVMTEESFVFDIYDYIYSQGSVMVTGGMDVILNGTFFVNDDIKNYHSIGRP